MKPIQLLLAMTALALLPCVSLAQTDDDCHLKCAAERDTRNIDCPAANLDDPNSIRARNQCVNDNQAAYYSCASKCPAPSPGSTPPGGQTPMSPPMGY